MQTESVDFYHDISIFQCGLIGQSRAISNYCWEPTAIQINRLKKKHKVSPIVSNFFIDLKIKCNSELTSK
jgi:hypothetical protein